ncbi:hypothetical protein N8H71_08665 [Pseudomonas koreensis]|uniref:hypothetical protein n=1 Tax=Pseudomonas koreensis TaxID=198620 RepID=UPI0021CA3AB1|nr:hypothetical protein [Pseudomonas koreensis]MCU0071660.1 hypothetical protein [Pseudomonas koreensis]
MSKLKNFVAIDWRAGPDRIYFFFKNSDTYSRYDISDNRVLDIYPKPVKEHWSEFDPYAKHLRFGFTRTAPGLFDDADTSWLFFYNDDTPWVCAYDQDADKVSAFYRLSNSLWAPLLPYFDRIVAGTWWEVTSKNTFRFLLSNGDSLVFDTVKQQLTLKPSTNMRGLEPYKQRIITAAQVDPTFSDSLWYIFLTNDEFIIYNMQKNQVAGGLRKVDSFPGLLRGL